MPQNSKEIVALAIMATIALVAFGPMIGAVNSGTGEITVDNETVISDIGSDVDLRGYNIDSGSESVEFYNSTDDTWDAAVSGTDYEMNYDGGSIRVLSGGAIDDGTELRVDYTYQSTDGSTTVILGIVPLLVALFVMVVIANKVTDGL